MKKLYILALSMLLSTSTIIMPMHEPDYDIEHNLDKKRNDNTYDGSKDACDGRYVFVDDGYDTYDEIHHLNKKRNSEENPVCSKDHPLIDAQKTTIIPKKKKSKVENTTDDSIKIQKTNIHNIRIAY